MCIMQTSRTSTCCLRHRFLQSLHVDYSYRSLSRTVSKELSIHHLWCFVGPSTDKLSVWQMRSYGPLAPCRLFRVTTLGRVTANGSLPKFWLYKAVVACSLTTCQVTVSVVWPSVKIQTQLYNKAPRCMKMVTCQRHIALSHTQALQQLCGSFKVSMHIT